MLFQSIQSLTAIDLSLTEPGQVASKQCRGCSDPENLHDARYVSEQQKVPRRLPKFSTSRSSPGAQTDLRRKARVFTLPLAIPEPEARKNERTDKTPR